MKIGIFDSGMGGLTVLARCLEAVELKGWSPTFVYFADSDYAPYGERTIQEVQILTRQAVKFLIEEEQVDIIVVACNTATSLAIEQLRSEFSIPLIGIEPAIKPAMEHSDIDKRILVTATPLMIESQRLKDRILELGVEDRVDRISLPGLVHLAEDESLNWQERQIEAKKYLNQMIPTEGDENYGSVVLGCTHFPIFLTAYQEVFSERGLTNVYFADGAEGVARQLIASMMDVKSYMLLEDKKPSIRFYQSGRRVRGSKEKRFEDLLKEIQEQI